MLQRSTSYDVDSGTITLPLILPDFYVVVFSLGTSEVDTILALTDSSEFGPSAIAISSRVGCGSKLYELGLG